MLALLADPALAQPPQRICSVSLAGDEYLALLVAPERVACVSVLADDPTLSNVADHFPDSVSRVHGKFEPLLALRPDLVLAAPWNSQGFLALLGRSGIPSLVLDEVTGFDDVRTQLLALGRLLGEEQRAQILLQEFDAKLAEVDEIAESSTRAAPVRVLSFSHLVVAGEQTTVDALIRRAGGVNAAAELGIRGHRKISMERIIALDPDVLLLGFDAADHTDRILKAYPHLARTRAARTGRLIVLSPRLLTTVTPFLADGALSLAESLRGLATEP